MFQSTYTNEQNIEIKKSKTKYALIPPHSLESVGKILTFGADKYEENGWKNQEEPIKLYTNALMRHLVEFLKNSSSIDEESKFKHVEHLATNAMILCELVRTEEERISKNERNN